MVGEQPRIFATERLLTPFIQVVDDLGTAIVEHQLGGAAFRSAEGQSRYFAPLERLVSSVRNWAVKRLWCLLSALPTPGQRATLDSMRCSWFPRGADDRTWTVYDALRPRSAPEPCAKHSNASARSRSSA